jgi:hypothetical protein
VRLSLAVVLSAACSTEQSLVLFATPASVPADGLSIVELRAEIIFRDEPIADGKAVTFRADAPVLFETRDDAAAGELRPAGSSEVSPHTSAGAAVAYLLAPVAAASLSVSASFTTTNRDVLADEAAVEIGAPPLVAAGRIPGGTNDILTVEKYFQVDCDSPNVGAFVLPRPEIRVPCSVLVLRDVTGRSLYHTPVRFFAEAGVIEDHPANEDEPRRITYVVPAPPSRWPADVAPFDSEGWTKFGEGLIPGAVEQNPRDGVVTLLAVVRGQEALQDNNGNGVWDPGELFIDDGEPFLDVDDDGVFTLGRDEPCCDSNGNGQVDGPNGRWDADVWIGIDTRILWTGPVDPSSGRSGVDPASVSIPAQSGWDFVFTLVDGNGNPPASLGTSDRITFRNDQSTRLDFAQPTTFTLYDAFPFARAATYPARLFGEVERAVGATEVEGVRQVSFRMNDVRATTSASFCQSYNWTLEFDVDYTPGRDYTGADFDTESSLLSSSGVLEAASPCPNP